MAKNNKEKKIKKEVVEHIPEGMSKKDYADAAFRKKVTIINGCLLLVFVIAIVAVIFVGWYNTKQEDEHFQEVKNAFIAERDDVAARLAEIEASGGEFEDKAAVEITFTDDTFSYWIEALDDSYQADYEDEGYGIYAGATVRLEGMFLTRNYSTGHIQYWVYRKHDHTGTADHDHKHEDDTDGETEQVDIGEIIPIEVILEDGEEIPADGTWVSVVGVVGPDSTKGLSAVRSAKLTLMDAPGTEYVE